MAPANRPEIFLLSLAHSPVFDEIYSSLIDKLSESATVKRAKTVTGAVRYLGEHNPKAIIITDRGLIEDASAEVLQNVISYVQNGGLVIAGLHFPNFVRPDEFDNFFASAFALPWRAGDYHRTDFELNRSCVLPQGVKTSSLPGPYSMKTLHINNARPHEKIFVPVRNARTQSLVFAPTPVDPTQAAVTGAKIGNGYVVYCGDVNPEEGSDKVILALCGLRG
jgi:hypothetical protein